jgi:dTMP kinase
MNGLFITFEGNEGSGKSTQIKILADRLAATGRKSLVLREPGGTPIGEEIRHTLQHSAANGAMTPETELLLMNASRAQLVRESIRPALAQGQIVLCDRFTDSTLAYQAYGRQLPRQMVRQVIEIATGETKPDLTLMLKVPIKISELRRAARMQSSAAGRDRIEEAGRAFFERVNLGYDEVSAADPARIRVIDATGTIDAVAEEIWKWVGPLVDEPEVEGEKTYKSLGEWKSGKLDEPR